MCDYSLHNVASRPAAVGDRLVTTTFNSTSTRGFAACGERDVAVCLRPGTELAFESEVECDHPFARLLPRMGFGKLGGNLARFRQVNTDQPYAHHDALEFPNGRTVLVTRLRPGQYATVLQLPVSRGAPDSAESRQPDRQGHPHRASAEQSSD
jgi:hypothetical protein